MVDVMRCMWWSRLMKRQQDRLSLRQDVSTRQNALPTQLHQSFKHSYACRAKHPFVRTRSASLAFHMQIFASRQPARQIRPVPRKGLASHTGNTDVGVRHEWYQVDEASALTHVPDQMQNWWQAIWQLNANLFPSKAPHTSQSFGMEDEMRGLQQNVSWSKLLRPSADPCCSN